MDDKQRDNRERSNSNLNPFKPGQTGNPAGRPKVDKTLAGLANQFMDRLASDFKVFDKMAKEFGLGATALVRDVWVMSWLNKGATGNPTYLQEYLNRTDGKIPDRVFINKDPYEEKTDEELDQMLAESDGIDKSENDTPNSDTGDNDPVHD